MAYGWGDTATRLATAGWVVALAACGRLNFDDITPGPDAGCTSPIAAQSAKAGHDFMCAQLSDNSLRCWGNNDVGQLGDGTTTGRPGTGVEPVGGLRVTAYSVGYQHACAVANGDVYCWGRNDIGQLGHGDRSQRAVPTKITGLPSMSGVSAGGLSTCAWNPAGALYCWGQTSATAMQQADTPQLVVGIPAVLGAAVSSGRQLAGTDFGCLIGADATTWCWGSNAAYELADGTQTERITPVPSASGMAFVQLALGNSHACGRTADGSVYCWGLNVDGEGGVPSPSLLQQPTLVGVETIAELVAFGENTCVRSTLDNVYCFGDNDTQELGRAGADGFVPEQIAVPPSRAIALGSDHACAIGTDDVMRCWGSDRAGVIGMPDIRPVTTTGLNAVGLAAGGNNTCALSSDGSVYCWGRGALGVLGGGVQEPTATPQRITFPASVVAISVGRYHACVLLTDTTVWCWGSNEFGESLGPLPGGALVVTPAMVTTGGSPAGVFAGGKHSCATFAGGQPVCWGRNDEGALGNLGGASQAPSASLFTESRMMALGNAHTCTIDATNASMYCAGRNNEGQAGAGGTADVFSPALLSPTNVNAIAAGDLFTCASSASMGTTWCWGENIAGQLGVGTNVIARTPASITAGIGNIVQLAAGRSHVCSLSAAGKAYCWGANSSGQLGTGDRASTAVPIASPLFDGATRVVAGDRHTCGLFGFDVTCVGANDEGQLGGTEPAFAPRQAAFSCQAP